MCVFVYVCVCVCVCVPANSLAHIHICLIRFSLCTCLYNMLFSVCRQAGSVIEGSTVVKISDIMKFFQALPSSAHELTMQLLDTFPVLLLRQRNEAVLVNVEELIMNSDSFATLLTLDSTCNAQQSSTTVPKTHKSINPSSKCGRPTHVRKFPHFVEFIKHHGFAAHNCRREEVGTSGVTLDEIQKHLLETVPGLKKMGISKHTIARIIEPPRKATMAASRYKSLVKAQVPGKNAYREEHITNITFLLVLPIKENSYTIFIILCCDDMNKVKIGGLAVSRYHQIERFFPVDDCPNVPDHDFPVPGYLLIPSGYMRLLNNSRDSECIEEG